MEKEDTKYWVSKGMEYYKDKNYEEVIKCYDKAARLDPMVTMEASIFNNWGNALCKLAEIKQNYVLLERAFEKYEKATELEQADTKKSIAFHNWGNALYKLAENKKDKEREDLLNSAFEKYDKASQLNPQNATTFHNLGVTLFELAKIKQDYILFENVFEKYKEAIRLYKMNKYKAIVFNNWGLALSNLAEIKQDYALFQEAFEKYEEATQLDEKNATAFHNWGVALYNLAEINEDEDLFKSASEKYREAVKLYVTNIDKASVYYNLGVAFSKLAENKKDKEREDLLNCALEKYKEAIRLDSKNSSVFNNLGITFYKLAENKKDKEREDLLNSALEKYKEAIKLSETDIDKSFAYYNWGIALHDIAEIKQDENLYEKAEECFIKSKQDILRIFVSLYNDNKKRIFQTKYFYKLLDNNEFFLKSIEKDKTKLNEYKDVYLRSIFIISQLHINNENEKTVAYYREKDISQKLLFDSNSKFRLNAINYSNDPTEGKTLLDFLYGEKNRPTDEELNTGYEAFAGCFTFNYDSLNQFRLYGKEYGKEGTGLSLVFKDSFFNKEARMAYESDEAKSSIMEMDNEPTEINSPIIKKTNSNIKENKSSLFRCIYIDPQSKPEQPIATVGQKEEYLFSREGIWKKFGDYNKERNIIIEDVRKEMTELKKHIENEKLEITIVGRLLLNLRYLVKHIAFKEEQECRIVKILNLSKDKEKIKDSEFKQLYFEYPFAVPMYIDKIYFGPKAKDFELFKSMLKYKGLDKIKCKKSENPLA